MEMSKKGISNKCEALFGKFILLLFPVEITEKVVPVEYICSSESN